MSRVPDDKFRIFVSHKHSDASLAKAVAREIEGLSEMFDCWVSGEDISSGSDWNRSITTALSRSHLLLLLFTAPSSNWDWCLYEAGLFIRFSDHADDDVRSVVSIFDPAGSAPRPLAGVQGVKAESGELEKFLTRLCAQPWEVCDEWRRGPIVDRVDTRAVASAGAAIAEEFATALGSAVTPPTDVHFPCHRIVLDVLDDPSHQGIPRDAAVVVGEGATSGYTLSLFGLAAGDTPHEWAALIDAVQGADAQWRSDLDAAYDAARGKRLFAPSDATMLAWDRHKSAARPYHPVLYSIEQLPGQGGRRARIVVVLDPRPVGAT